MLKNVSRVDFKSCSEKKNLFYKVNKLPKENLQKLLTQQI